MPRKSKIERIKLKLSNLHNNKYYKYMLSPEWKALLKAHFIKSGFRCRLCNGSEGGLNLHHRTYVRLGREKAMDLVVLCGKCHKFFHEHLSLVREVRKKEGEEKKDANRKTIGASQ